MKIIKRPTFPIQECKNCGCKFKIKPRDLKTNRYSPYRQYVKCPICKYEQYALFGNENIYLQSEVAE